MIILDTNVVSALMLREPDPVVVEWLDGLPPESIWTTSITVFEVRLGLEILEAGKRRRQLEDAFERALEEDLENRVLPFDQSAAQAAGLIASERRRSGRSVEIRDVQIAGIVNVRKGTLATRNIRHFEGSELELLNPWATKSARSV